MHALLALMALMAGAAAAAWAAWAAWTNWGLLPRLMLVNLVAAIPFILKYRRRIYVVAKTLPRDIRFVFSICVYDSIVCIYSIILYVVRCENVRSENLFLN